MASEKRRLYQYVWAGLALVVLATAIAMASIDRAPAPVFEEVNGTTIRGRSARVDFDRGGPRGRSPAKGRAGPRKKIRRDPRQER